MRTLITLTAALALGTPALATPGQDATRIQYRAQLLVHCGMMSGGEYGAIISALNDRIAADPARYRDVRNVDAPVPPVSECLALRRQLWGY